MASLRPPKIAFVKPNILKFVLLVEDTAVMNEQVSKCYNFYKNNFNNATLWLRLYKGERIFRGTN